MPKTMFEKIWEQHVVHEEPGQPSLIYIDLHLIHEMTTAQAFAALRESGRSVRRPDLTIGTCDHAVETTDRELPTHELRRYQVKTFIENCRANGIRLYDMRSPRQGIVHIIGPEHGLTQPGKTIVCGDSHTSTHGGVGALAFGIGTSEVEQVLATQCLLQRRPTTMVVHAGGALPDGVTAKDLILAIIGQMGIAGGTGHVIEYTGEAVRGLTMEGRLTLCNMTIEGGARAGMVAPDETTFEYLRGRPFVPQGADFDRVTSEWRQLATDPGARYDRVLEIDASRLAPQVTWGTNPAMVTSIEGRVPDPSTYVEEADRRAVARALEYMDLRPGTPLAEVPIDTVFIGSCTNSRLEDLREAATILRGRRKHPSVVRALVVPGSYQVKRQAEAEGLDRVFKEAGFEWRESACSMCVGVNSDVMPPGARSASTSNRNFEGRQGRDARTHLVSPAMAAAAAIAGHFVDVRDLERHES